MALANYGYTLLSELYETENNGFGYMYFAKHVQSGYFVAIKKFCMENISDEAYKMICSEIILMRKLKHSNIQSVLSCFVCNGDVYMVSSYMCYGSCRSVLKTHFTSGFPELLIALVLRDVVQALTYLHYNGYIHGSLRGSHILMNEKKAVISRFRESKSCLRGGKRSQILHNFSMLNEKSIKWLAPEILEQDLRGFTDKSDIYSVGMVCCELSNGLEPYLHTDSTLMYVEKVCGYTLSLKKQHICFDVETCNEELLAAKRNKYSTLLYQFANTTMSKNPSDRLSAEQLTTHPVFKQCRHTTISDQMKFHVPLTTTGNNFRSREIKFSTDDSVTTTAKKWDFD